MVLSPLSYSIQCIWLKSLFGNDVSNTWNSSPFIKPYLLLQIATWSTSPHHTSYFLETRLATCLSWVFTSPSASRHQLFLSQLWNGWSLFLLLGAFYPNLNNITIEKHRRDSKSVKVFLENIGNIFISNLGVTMKTTWICRLKWRITTRDWFLARWESTLCKLV